METPTKPRCRRDKSDTIERETLALHFPRRQIPAAAGRESPATVEDANTLCRASPLTLDVENNGTPAPAVGTGGNVGFLCFGRKQPETRLRLTELEEEAGGWKKTSAVVVGGGGAATFEGFGMAFQSDRTAYFLLHRSHLNFFSPCFRQKCFLIPVRSPRAREGGGGRTWSPGRRTRVSWGCRPSALASTASCGRAGEAANSGPAETLCYRSRTQICSSPKRFRR
nr:hypothetical protein Iba_chr01eCG3160 [Ipomoea batatas]